MLFNSIFFIFLYLPLIVIGFYFIGKYSHNFAMLWLTIASLFFYGWWDAHFVGLLLSSIVFNYSAAYLILKSVPSSDKSKLWLILAITINLVLLGYYKYANFFIANINNVTGSAYPIKEILLPLGISFFTFTQIAFLVDTYQNKAKEYSFIHYILFVTYFPHLIAGPILHHKEMMSQFDKRNVCSLNWNNLAVGITIFVLGLAKKEMIADELAGYATPIFDAVKIGELPMFVDAWVGALAYSLQLYFDFSGYCDMAIGLSLLFNVRLPLNFNSPYKASSIIEFWQRWHMTLSRFLRDYLYIPLGGNRKGNMRRYLNLMITMLLGGFWHGAGWTFMIWGGLHGGYLIINHAWRNLKKEFNWSDGGVYSQFWAGLLTFASVVVGWVFFRADSLKSAMIMLRGMLGMNGVSLSASLADTDFGQYLHQHYDWVVFNNSLILSKPIHIVEVAIVFLIVWALPNTIQFTGNYQPVVNSRDSFCDKGQRIMWHPALLYATLVIVMFFYSADNIYKPSPFLYFQF